MSFVGDIVRMMHSPVLAGLLVVHFATAPIPLPNMLHTHGQHDSTAPCLGCAWSTPAPSSTHTADTLAHPHFGWRHCPVRASTHFLFSLILSFSHPFIPLIPKVSHSNLYSSLHLPLSSSIHSKTLKTS